MSFLLVVLVVIAIRVRSLVFQNFFLPIRPGPSEEPPPQRVHAVQGSDYASAGKRPVKPQINFKRDMCLNAAFANGSIDPETRAEAALGLGESKQSGAADGRKITTANSSELLKMT